MEQPQVAQQEQRVQVPRIMIDPDLQGCDKPNLASYRTMMTRNLDKLAVMGKMTKEQAEVIAGDILLAVERSDDDRLKKVTPASLWSVAYDLLRTGLSFDVRGLAYLTSYEVREKRYNQGKGRTESIGTGVHKAKLEISYRGFIYQLRRAYPDLVERSFILFEGDEFCIQEQDGQSGYVYKPKDPFRDDWKNCRGVAVYLAFTNAGGVRKSWVTTMSYSEICDAMKMSKQDLDKPNAVWNKWWGEMAKKTVLRRACKIESSTIQSDVAHIIAETEAVDNEGYELPKSPMKAAQDESARVREEMRAYIDAEKERINPTTQALPEEQAKPIDGDVLPPEEQAKPEVAQQATTDEGKITDVNEAEPEEQPKQAEPVSPEIQQLLNDAEDFIALINETEDQESRKSLYENNKGLMDELATSGQIKMIETIVKLVTK